MNAKTEADRPACFRGFPDATFRFLRGITHANTKVWFEAHRADYRAAYVEPARALVAALGPRLRKISRTVQFDPKINGSIFRINRDTRFSKDKTPYKNHLDLWFWHGDRRGWDTPSFFFRMFSDRAILGAGMHKFEGEGARRFREAVVSPKSGKALVAAIGSVRAAGEYEIGGASRKRVPRGFDPEHERGDLLLHDGLWAQTELVLDEHAQREAFVDVCADHFGAVWPVGRWLLREVSDAR